LLSNQHISFSSLKSSHFPLLLKWLETSHVKKWWPEEFIWTLALVENKYQPYIQGYNLVDGKKKVLKAYIISYDEQPIGYIQLYNAHDFSRKKKLDNLPGSLGAIDFYLGEEAYLGKGLGVEILNLFLSDYVTEYEYVFVDPDINNTVAIKTYEKTGFERVAVHQDTHELWLMKHLRKSHSD
jgi:aminoglycoside 6'-N-acetyltransferase